MIPIFHYYPARQTPVVFYLLFVNIVIFFPHLAQLKVSFTPFNK